MPTQSTILIHAGQLSQSIRNSADPLRTLSSVLGILAQGCDHDDMCSDLERAAADAQTYAEMADAKAADKLAQWRAEHDAALERRFPPCGRRNDHLFNPEVV